MNVILLGPPGAGKGTQAKELAARRGLIQLSTGEMLRAAIRAGSDVGRRVKTIMDAGNLVPDDVVIKIISDRIDLPDCRPGVILDGFPRNLQQAAALDKMLKEKGRKLDVVVELKVDDEKLVERVAGRFTCSKCGEGYHDKFKQPKVVGVCDICGSTQFTRRQDDNAETINRRLMVYYRETSPLTGYYFCKGNLRSVDGMGSMEEVGAAIETILDGFK